MIRIINLTCVLIFTCFLQTSTNADSRAKNETSYKIFQDIEQNSGYSHSALLSSGIKRILRVPSQYATISEAVLHANTGDTVIISPGSYTEKNIELNKAIIISSEWKLTGDKSTIEKTAIDAADSNLFIINANGVEISGLRVVNGDHGIRAFAKAKIIYNHLINSRNDAISLESGGGGYIANNLIENSHDDGIDIDIGETPDNIGSDVIVEYNTIINSRDDGMEIRLFATPNQNIHYEIRNNIILDSRNAGIQLISYDVNSGKIFNIHHNIFKGCKTALGCMEGAKTREDLIGASKMDEKVYFYNNTIIENKIAATGGNNIIAANNIVVDNALGGFKRFGKNSVIANNLFFKNNNADLIEIDQSAIKKNNLFDKDPFLNKSTFTLDAKSPAINYGIEKLVVNKQTLFVISPDLFTGVSPDLGAVEVNNKYPGSPLQRN